MTSSPSISDTILTALSTPKFCEDPFPHWTADNLLPPATLNDFQQLPSSEQKLNYSEGARATNNKFRQYLHGNTIIQFEDEKEVSEAFQSPKMIRLLKSLCHVDLSNTYLRIEYACDNEGFWLAPHTDIGAKKFTLLLYLSDAYGEDWGTSLYSDSKTFHSNTPWQCNRAMFFVPSDRSWHGFEKREINQPRKSLIINYVCAEWRSRHELAYPDQLTRSSTILA